MKTQPLNYIRKAMPFLKDVVAPALVNAGCPKAAEYVKELVDESTKTPKFVIPAGGRIIEGQTLRCLPEKLKLPYPEIFIEYEAVPCATGVVEQIWGDAAIPAPKRIVYAQEVDGYIDVVSIIYIRGIWSVAPYVLSMWRSDVAQEYPVFDALKNTRPIDGVVSTVFPFADMDLGLSRDDFYKHAMADMLDEGNAVLALIEALSCRNVTHEVIPARKQIKHGKRTGALPFDDYRVLVIKNSTNQVNPSKGGHHRSPREHLRRGHIRRLESGNVWVNSCVVNSGIGSCVRKDYALAA